MRNRNAALCIALALALALCGGCIADEPILVPAYTLPPTPSPTPDPTPVPTESAPPAAVPEATPVEASGYDMLGKRISGADHYKAYLRFENIQVYEQCEDTFLDMMLLNEYPAAILCALTVRFYEKAEGEGEPVAEGELQTRDGQYVLLLQPGENPLYAQINTDMTLTALPFTLEYSEELGVYPAA